MTKQGGGVCCGKYQGLVDGGEELLSTGARNHKGGDGADTAEVYLCSPAIAAHSALAGAIMQGGR